MSENNSPLSFDHFCNKFIIAGVTVMAVRPPLDALLPWGWAFTLGSIAVAAMCIIYDVAFVFRRNAA